MARKIGKTIKRGKHTFKFDYRPSGVCTVLWKHKDWDLPIDPKFYAADAQDLEILLESLRGKSSTQVYKAVINFSIPKAIQEPTLKQAAKRSKQAAKNLIDIQFPRS